MDYEFIVDDNACPSAIFSIGHEAVGLWFSEELGRDLSAIQALLHSIERVDNRAIGQDQIRGAEFQLNLEKGQITLRSLALAIDFDEPLQEGMNLYDQESYAECGLIDFKQALLRWKEFVLSLPSKQA
jgi:uncharacterized protein YacL (UPF0231 family)